ncbi:MAG: hypothetical protein K0S43_2104, partial [Cellulosimicrobium sp.]|nr:hypothetical protein [Cellulosimicrobium sp.]
AGTPADQVGPDQVRRAWTSIVAAVRALHDVPTAGCPFDRGLRPMYALAQDVVARGAVRREFLRPEQESRKVDDLLAELAAELPVRQEQEAADQVVCHGDLCLPNILLDPETLEVSGFVDLGRLSASPTGTPTSRCCWRARRTPGRTRPSTSRTSSSPSTALRWTRTGSGSTSSWTL